MATARPLTVHRNADHWFDLGDETTLRLTELNVVLMRKDPPFDMEYIYATYLLERAEREGTLVVNRCQSLRDCNEKLFATEFPECCPPLLVSRDMGRLRAFHSQHDDVIFKPLDGMGGSAIFRAQPGDPNVSVILETLTQSGRQTIMAQQYLPAIQEGDKRILMINGEAVPWSLASSSGRREPWQSRRRWFGNSATAHRARSMDCQSRWAYPQGARSLLCWPRCDRRLPHRN